MARARKPPKSRDYAAETARRNERARAAGFADYYEQRIARFMEEHPGATREEARGHGGVAEKLRRAIRKAAKQGGYVSFFGNDRQADGTWRIASFVVGGDDGEREFILGPNVHGPGGLDRLPGIGEVIDETGILFIGDRKYLQQMIDWVEKQ